MAKIDAVRFDVWDELRLCDLPPALRYAAAALLTALATLIAVAVDHEVHIPNLSLVFVLPVIIAAVNFGWGPSLAAAVLGALAYNVFLTEPRYSIQVEDPANIWAIGLLFVVGTLVSAVASAGRRRGREAARQTGQLVALEGLGRRLAAAGTDEDAAAATANALSDLFGSPAAVVLWREPTAQPRVAGADLSDDDIAAARGVAETGRVGRAGVYPDHASRCDFWPAGPAVLAIAIADDGRPATQGELVGVAGALLALALGRLSAPKR